MQLRKKLSGDLTQQIMYEDGYLVRFLRGKLRRMRGHVQLLLLVPYTFNSSGA